MTDRAEDIHWPSQIAVRDWSKVIEELVADSRPTLVIVAPNFEDRSLALAEEICLLSQQSTDNFRIGVLTLQGSEEWDTRDYIKARNCNRCMELLLEAGYKSDVSLFHFPVENPLTDGQVEILVETLSTGLSSYNLLVDVSCLPRSFLWKLLSVVKSEGTAAEAKSMFLAYKWAKSYSSLLEHESAGQLVDHVRKRPIVKLVEDYRSVDMVLFGGGTTSSALDVLNIVRSHSHSRDIEMEFISFLRPNRLRHFWDGAVRQQEVVAKTARKDRVNKSYVFDEEHALYWLRDLAQRSFDRYENRDNHIFIIIPGGPKIISIISQFVASEYQRKIYTTGESQDTVETKKPLDVLNHVAVGGHGQGQYLSVYSLGSTGETSCIKVLATK